MAQFFSPKARKSSAAATQCEITVERLDHQGQGVGSHKGKIVFIEGLLPTEQAKVSFTKEKGRFATAKVLKRLSDSEFRCKPKCRHFDQCGGCQLQYADEVGQRQFKQQALASLMAHHLGEDFATDAHGESSIVAAPISSEPWGYRRRVRLGVRFHKGTLTLGFRQRLSNNLVDLQQCPVMAQPLEALIAPLRQQLQPMPLAKKLGHIDLLLANEGAVVVLRLLRSVSAEEQQQLQQWQQQHQCELLIDDGNNIRHLNGSSPQPLHYHTGADLPSVAFQPGDFFQVNDQVNKKMVAQALEWLAPQSNETGLDLFCGGGNFSLPLATRSAKVIGVEGVEAMSQRANAQAKALGLNNVEFYSADLNGAVPKADWAQQPVDWVLLDPARAGAGGALTWLPKLAPKRIVYVSCSPLTLAQDAKTLSQQGYSLCRLGLVDMFPHTGHLESMALFTRN